MNFMNDREPLSLIYTIVYTVAAAVAIWFYAAILWEGR